MKNIKKSIAISVVTVMLGGCAGTGNEVQMSNKEKGALIGAIAGAVLGASTKGHKKGKRAAIGAIAGAMAGGAIGYSMDKQAKEVAQSLKTDVDNSPNAEKNADKDIIVTQNENYVKIIFRDSMMFETNSATPTPTAMFKINKLIPVLENYPQTIIQVAGHTDNRGTHKYNLKLSEKRAANVANTLINKGLKNKIYAKGCSYDKAVMPNTSAENMGLNRRVEIFLYPNENLAIDPCL